MSKVHFLTFGDHNQCANARDKLVNEVRQTGVFDTVTGATPNDFTGGFWKQHGDFIRRNARGYGYWIWKPWLIARTLREKCKVGDVLIYLDAGFAINQTPKSMRRLRSYITQARQLNNPNEPFEETNKLPKIVKWLCFKCSPQNTIGKYTKRRTLAEFAPAISPSLVQYQSGAHVILCTPQTRAFADEWMRGCELLNYKLLDDSHSKDHPETREFSAHRHDQSIFSLLARKHGLYAYPTQTWFAPHWKQNGADYPFWAKRRR